MKYLIVEDEYYAYEEIKRMITRLRPDYVLLGWTESIENTISFLRRETPQLLIMDIRLADGLSFDVFHRIDCNVPVIFTTAYDEYALQAFKTNSVDYLLKPVDEDDMQQALLKFERNNVVTTQSANYIKAEDEYLKHCIRTRIMVQVGDEYRSIEVTDIACFYSEEKTNYLITMQGKRYIVDYTLDQLECMLARDTFCRISRGCIAHIHAVKKCYKHFAGRLGIQLITGCPEEIIVSRSRVAEVLKWIDGQKS